jgi:hypothetical protein
VTCSCDLYGTTPMTAILWSVYHAVIFMLFWLHRYVIIPGTPWGTRELYTARPLYTAVVHRCTFLPSPLRAVYNLIHPCRIDALLRSFMLLNIQTSTAALAILVSQTSFPMALARMCLSRVLAIRAPARRVHTGATAAAQVCAGATSCYDVQM